MARKTALRRSPITDTASWYQYVNELVANGGTQVSSDVLVDKAVAELTDAEKAVVFPLIARQTILSTRTLYLQRQSREYADSLTSGNPVSVQTAPKMAAGRKIAIHTNTTAPSRQEIDSSYRNTHNPSRGLDVEIPIRDFTVDDLNCCARYFREQGNTYHRRADWYVNAANMMTAKGAAKLGAIYDDVVAAHGAHQ